jgi:hypothetical protein
MPLLLSSRAGLLAGLACRAPLALETKSRGPASTAVRSLWRHRLRSIALSGFGVGMAQLEPQLPANKFLV